MTKCVPLSGPRRLFAWLGVVVAVGALAASARAATPPGVHGRVIALDEKSKPTGVVGGAKIEFKDASGKAVAQTTGDSGSYYRVELPPGTYFYKVSAPGFKTEDHGRGITLTLSEGLAVYNFSLSKGQDDPQRKAPQQTQVSVGRLCGRVLEKTAEGALVGIPHAAVSLRREHGGRRLTRIVARKGGSDRQDAGGYEVVLEAGTWRASAAAEGFETLVDPNPIRIVEGRTATRDFILTREKPNKPERQGIKGLVSLAHPKSPHGASATAERTAPQVEVQIVRMPRAGRPGHRLRPQTGGQYAQDLGQGVYQVLAKADGYRPARSRPAYVFDGKYTVVNLTLVRGGKPEPLPQPLALEAAVLERLPHQGTRPLSGADVLVRAQRQSLAAAPRGTTGAEGKVRLQVGRVGSYVALAQKLGYKPGGVRVEITATGSNRAEIVLEKEKEKESPTLPSTPGDKPQQPVAVRGYVVQADKTSPTGFRAVPGSDVTWTSAQTRQAGASARADDAGRFSLALPEGRYVAAVTPPPGFIGTRKEVDVRPEIGLQHFVVTRTGDSTDPGTGGGKPGNGPGSSPVPGSSPRPDVVVTGHVVYLDRSSPTGARAVANADIGWRGTGFKQLKRTRTDSSGRFSIRLPQGEYLALVKPPPGFLGTKEQVHVHAGMAGQRFVVQRVGGSTDPGTGGGQTGHGPGGFQTPEQTKRLTLNLRIVERMAGKPGLSAARGPASRPVVGARVVVQRHGQGVAGGQSDQGGVYRTQLAPASYTVEVTRPGYLPAHGAVTLAAGDVTREIVLTRAGGTGLHGEANHGGFDAGQKSQGSSAGQKSRGSGTRRKLQRSVNGLQQQAAGGKWKGPVLKPKPKIGATPF